MFDVRTIEDHAVQPRGKLDLIKSNIFSGSGGLDSCIQVGKRTARSIMSDLNSNARSVLKKHKRKPFWQFSPDKSVIERLYDPEDEPLILEDG